MWGVSEGYGARRESDIGSGGRNLFRVEWVAYIIRYPDPSLPSIELFDDSGFFCHSRAIGSVLSARERGDPAA